MNVEFFLRFAARMSDVLRMPELNRIPGEIVDSAFHLHRRLGPGLLETVKEVLLAKELKKRGYQVERQKPVSIEFDGVHFDEGFRADLLVESAVVVELKSVEKMSPVHAKQLLTYLRLMDLRLGLLINFGAPVIKDGIKRIVNGLDPESPSLMDP